MRAAASWLVWLLACGAPAPAPVATPTASPPPVLTPAKSTARDGANRAARWSNITPVENCFYFSGPFNGREEQLHGQAKLEIDDGRVTLRLASAVFDGTLDGDAITVGRKVTREFEGAWTVTETIVGTYRDGELRGQYRYEECGQNEPCPGRCTMTADLIAIMGLR